VKTALLLSLLTTCAFAANWPNWRGGTDGSGTSTETELPLKWSATEGVKWKIPMPERGNSTPVVWGDKIFVTQAIEAEKKRSLVCYAKATGARLWEQSVVYSAQEPTHGTNPYCSASPTTDGQKIVVSHGSAGVFCYDLDGKLLWQRDLGKQEFEWGNGSSPVLHGATVYLYHGPGKGARLVALDAATGKDVWTFNEPAVDVTGRTDGFRGNEPGVICTYATPIITKTGGREELIMPFPKVLRAFDPATGKELWSCEGLNPLVYASPIAAEGIAFVTGGYMGNSIAVPTGGTGDMTEKRLWQKVRTKNRLGTGVIHQGHAYIFNTDGFAECIELKTGNTVYMERVRAVGPKGDSWSSSVLSGDRIYILNQSGDCHIIRATPKFELIASNGIGSELTNASVAVSDGLLFIRTHEHLWCIGK
jgi:outer membrane protein assembly factor BamB